MAKKIHYEEFLSKAKEIWGDRFIYPELENFDYRKGIIEIICPIQGHGPFERVPSNHIYSNNHRKPAGCPKCFREADRKAKMKPFSKFLEDARKVHGQKYEYVESTYDGAKKNMKIIYSKHGSFPQTPDAHINGGQGCDICADEATSIRNVARGLKNAQKKVEEFSAALKVTIVTEFVHLNRRSSGYLRILKDDNHAMKDATPVVNEPIQINAFVSEQGYC